MEDIGKAVCRIVREGGTPQAIDAANFKLLVPVGYTASMDRAAIITGAANNMCPDIGPLLREHNEIVREQQQAPQPTDSPFANGNAPGTGHPA